MYVEHVENNFDMKAIRETSMNFAYDAMFGAGQNVMRRLLPDITFMHCDYNPGFEGQAQRLCQARSRRRSPRSAVRIAPDRPAMP